MAAMEAIKSQLVIYFTNKVQYLKRITHSWREQVYAKQQMCRKFSTCNTRATRMFGQAEMPLKLVYCERLSILVLQWATTFGTTKVEFIQVPFVHLRIIIPWSQLDLVLRTLLSTR